MNHPRDPAAHYALIGLSGLATTVLTGLVLAAAFAFAVRHAAGPPATPRPSSPPPPRIEVNDARDRARVEADGARRLAGARIPIDQAMALTAQRGWDNGATAP